MRISAQGTTFGVNDGTGSGDLVNIECIRSFSGFDGESSEIDITCLTSIAKEYRLGLVDNGNISLQLFRDDSDFGQARLEQLRISGQETEFRITLNVAETGGDTYDFRGFVKSFTIDASVDNVLEGEVNIRINGPVTHTNN